MKELFGINNASVLNVLKPPKLKRQKTLYSILSVIAPTPLSRQATRGLHGYLGLWCLHFLTVRSGKVLTSGMEEDMFTVNMAAKEEIALLRRVPLSPSLSLSLSFLLTLSLSLGWRAAHTFRGSTGERAVVLLYLRPG